MTRLALRTILAGLLIATAAGKVWRSRAAEPDIRTAVIALVALEGWSAYEETGSPDDPLGKAIKFRADGCDGLGQVFLVDLGLQLAPLLDRAIGPGYSRRFVYLGRTWLTQDRLGMRLEWLRNKALSLFGLGRYVANETVLVIAEPRECRSADKVNWGAVWEPARR